MTGTAKARAVAAQRKFGAKDRLRLGGSALFLATAMVCTGLPDAASAQNYRFNTVQIDGNQRIEDGTILTYAGIARGQSVSAGQLNSAYQAILGSGLFETVELVPQGNKLVIKVTEYPTISRISFEGNRRLKDDALSAAVESQERRVFSPTAAERDAANIAEAYSQQGRLAARVTPRIIRRSDNRVDLVFEIFEGGVTEIERIGFVGNRAYSDSRLRRVLETKQAGLLRALFKSDTFVEDRVEFDKQVLRDFYFSRGYVDFRTTGVNAELAEERDGFFMTFNVQEGQQFRFGEITTSSDLAEVDADEFLAALKVKSGGIYSPTIVENNIARLERLAIRKGYDFVRVEPRINRNDRDLSLDVEFALVRGPRVFVERIDIEGNTTTLDRVVRSRFRVAEGDPFNPREIRESAERIRALGYFGNADVQARQGSTPDQVIVDVEVEEASTGSLSFGGTYSTNGGLGLVVEFTEKNFLGRGQSLNLSIAGGEDNKIYGLKFSEPTLLGRDLQFDLDVGYKETENEYATYDTTTLRFSPGFTFPVSENGRLNLYYKAQQNEMISSGGTTGTVVSAEIADGSVIDSSLGYNYSYDTRRAGLNPNAGVLFTFGQEFAGVGGDTTFVKTQAKVLAQTKILNEEVTLRASLEGGAMNYTKGDSRSVDRYQIGNGVMRGFEPDGIGPREYNVGTGVNDALGGNLFVVAKFEAEFPLGLPEELGIRGGLFYDIGTVWDIGNTRGAAASDIYYDDFNLRHVIGVSVFWKTPVGPLRLNFSKALQKEALDQEQTFNLTISSQF